jgi:hypothetical protein
MVGKFFRKGVVGDWKNYFDDESVNEWNRWIEENVARSPGNLIIFRYVVVNGSVGKGPFTRWDILSIPLALPKIS